MKLLLYCTKAKPYLYKTEDTTYPAYPIGYHTDKSLKVKLKNTNELANLNGKIVAECDFEVEEIEHYIHYESEVDVGICVLPEFECDAYRTNTLDHFKLLEKSCLKDYSLPSITVANELDDYLKGKNGYAIHIKNLHIFDEPKKLSEVCKYDFWAFKTFGISATPKDLYTPITKAPQNMCRVFDTQNHYEKNILISIQPQWLCKILNGEKTIEVRKKVLREMLL